MTWARCVQLVPAALPARRIPPACTYPDALLPHFGAIFSLHSENHDRLASLQASSEMLVAKLEEIRLQIAKGNRSPSVTSSAEEADADCPEWVDALGSGSGEGEESWIDEGCPHSPYAEPIAASPEAQ